MGVKLLLHSIKTSPLLISVSRFFELTEGADFFLNIEILGTIREIFTAALVVGEFIVSAFVVEGFMVEEGFEGFTTSPFEVEEEEAVTREEDNDEDVSR